MRTPIMMTSWSAMLCTARDRSNPGFHFEDFTEPAQQVFKLAHGGLPSSNFGTSSCRPDLEDCSVRSVNAARFRDIPPVQSAARGNGVRVVQKNTASDRGKSIA